MLLIYNFITNFITFSYDKHQRAWKNSIQIYNRRKRWKNWKNVPSFSFFLALRVFRVFRVSSLLLD